MARPFRYTIATCGLIMLVGAFFVMVRVAPLSTRGGVAWETLWPLVAAAMTTMLEAALVLGTPVGFALASETAPTRISNESAGGSASWPPSVGHAIAVWFLVAVAMGAYANVKLGAPGRVAHGVVQGARAVCEDSEQRRVEPVPLIGARWICAPSAAPRIVGEVVRNGTTARYSAHDLVVSEELDYVDLSDLDIFAPASKIRPAIHVAAKTARLRGAWPWAKARRISGLWRAVLVGSVASLLAMVVVHQSRRYSSWQRTKATFTAILGGSTAWYCLSLVDAHEQWPLKAYTWVPIGAIAAMLAVGWLLRLQAANHVVGAALGRIARRIRYSPRSEPRGG